MGALALSMLIMVINWDVLKPIVVPLYGLVALTVYFLRQPFTPMIWEELLVSVWPRSSG